MKFDDVVIGAGVSGLSAAILLAQKGRKVAVLEQASVTAPTIRGFVRNGIYFDTGFHYAAMLGEGEAFWRLCERLGIMSHLRVKAHTPDSGDLFIHAPSAFRFHFGESLRDLTEQLAERFPDESDGIRRYLAKVKNFLEQIDGGLFKGVMDPTALFQDGDLSLEQFLQETFRSPYLQTLLSIHSILYGSWPQETSLAYHTMISGGYYDQSFRIDNGGAAIAKAFDEVLQINNVTVLTNAWVDRIHLNTDNAVNAVSSGKTGVIECSNCIYTAHPRQLIQLFPAGTFRAVYASRLTGLEDTISAMVVYCRKRDARPQSCFSNIILSHSLFPALFSNVTEAEVPPLFISSSASDNHPGGISIICPWRYETLGKWKDSPVGYRDPDYYDWKKRTADKILDTTMRCCSDLLGELEVVDAASPLTFRDYMAAPRGGLYGAKHRITDMPLMSRTRVKGLFLSGQATLAAGVMGAMLSGFLSAAQITSEDYRKTIGR